MALRFLIDENLRGTLWRLVVRHNRRSDDKIDAVRVGDSPELPLASSDAEILAWCAREERILVSLDKATLATHLDHFLQAGGRVPGVFLLRRSATPSEVVDFLALVAHASDAWEWRDRIEFVP